MEVETAVEVADSSWNEEALELSAGYVGRWCRLVSTTNWEKGRLIGQWREAMIVAEQPASAYSDETWSQQVGGVSSQHVGRLRRVAQRFAEERESYARLYWSHFLAALDWDDAPMWLEGAQQSRWSVAQMRRQRDETLGVVATLAPIETAVQPLVESALLEDDRPESPEVAAESSLWEDDASADSGSTTADHNRDVSNGDSLEAAERTAVDERPFAALAALDALPEDLAGAFESFQLAILRHKMGGWKEVQAELVAASLDRLRELIWSDTGPSG